MPPERLMHFPQPLHAGSHTSRSYRVKTFLHLLGHLHHFTMGRSRSPRCVVGQYRYRGEEGKRQKRGRKRTLGPPADSGDHKNGPAPPFCLPLCIPLYPTYLPLFIPILKGSRPLVLHTDNPPHPRPPWLVAKHCCMLSDKMQTRLMPLPPREASS